MYDIIIIGAGMAGLTAAIYAVRAGKSVLILESGAVGGQIVSSFAVENWPGDKKIPGKDLMDRIYEQVVDFGAEVKYEEVLSAKKEEGGFKVVTDETEYKCKTLIIATGTKPRKLNDKQIEDVGNRPVSYCATCDGALYKGKPVVVIGGGNTAKHEVSYLSGICSKVYNVQYDEPIPEDAEAVFVAIGRIPTTDVFKDLIKIDSDGYIVAQEDCLTSCDGVFVAGDCRTKSVRQLVTAASDGAVAAGAALKYLED